MADEDTPILHLGVNQAVSLWMKGRDAWNEWVKNHPKANISFHGYDFTPDRANGKRPKDMDEGSWPFSGYHFPEGDVNFEDAQFGKGEVNFSEAQFGDGEVNFWGAQFGDGEVNFWGAQFGEGEVNFRNAKFGEGNVNFSEAQFGEGWVNFARAQFGDGWVNFSEAQFGEGNVYFSEAQFGESNVNFGNAQFGEGNVYFRATQFGEGEVAFRNAQFGEGDVDFRNAQFGEGDVNFSEAQFGEGDVDFRNAQFGEGDVNFAFAQFGDGWVDFSEAQFGDGNVYFRATQFGEGDVSFFNAQFGKGEVSFMYAQFGKGNTFFLKVCFGKGKVNFSRVLFGGRTFFENLQKVEEITAFDFQHSTFEGSFVLSSENNQPFNCIPDLCGTKYSHQIVLDKITYNPQIDWTETFGKFLDAKDGSRLRRLKEISEQNKNRDDALKFKALELQAERHHTNTHPVTLLLETLFRVCSNYGRSVLRPFLGLIALWWICGLIYASSIQQLTPVSAFAFSARQMFPLINSLRDKDFKIVYENANELLNLLMFTQSIVSLILLFLVGLALRNQFRL